MQKEYSKVEMESGTPIDGARPKRKTNKKSVLSTIPGIVIATLLLLGLVVLTRYRAVLPTTMRPFDLNDTSISHPIKPYTISGAANISFCSLIVIFVTINWFFWEQRIGKKNVGKIMLTVYFIMLGACFMILLVNSMKNLAGHLRPFFLSACQPNKTTVAELRAQGKSWVDENMTKTICTSKKSLKYRWSFPSGHSAEAWYGMTLSILIIHYTKNITAQFSDNVSLMLPFKAVLQFILFAFASWIGISRTLDHHHFWWDVLAGSLLGALIATVMFYWYVKPVMESSEKCSVTCLDKFPPFRKLQRAGCCGGGSGEDLEISQVELEQLQSEKEHAASSPEKSEPQS